MAFDIQAKCTKEKSVKFKWLSDKDWLFDATFEKDSFYSFEKVEQDGETIFVNHSKISGGHLSEEEFFSHFEIVYEKGKLNSCLKDGIPCVKLREKHNLIYGDNRNRHSCSIRWDCGRASCCEYEPDTEFDVKQYEYLLEQNN